MFPDCLCWLPVTWRTPGRRTTTDGVQGECSGRLGTPRLPGPDRRVRRGDMRLWVCIEILQRNSSDQAALPSPTLIITDFSCWGRSRACWSSHVLPDRTRFTPCIFSHILVQLSAFRDTEQNNRSFNTQILWNYRCSSSLAALSSALLPGPQQMLHKSSFYNMSVPLKRLLKISFWIHTAVQHSQPSNRQ